MQGKERSGANGLSERCLIEIKKSPTEGEGNIRENAGSFRGGSRKEKPFHGRVGEESFRMKEKVKSSLTKTRYIFVRRH